MTTFISYSRANSDFAASIANDLRSAGFDMWLDQLDIPTGSRWDDELEKALDRCSTFLIILSPESIKSQNVKDEIGYAIDSGKHILPVLIKNCKIPARLRRFQFVDFTDDSYKKNLDQIKYLLGNTSELLSVNNGTSEEEKKDVQPSLTLIDRATQTYGPKRPLKVFLCHAHADRDAVRSLYTRLTKDGVDAWLDKEKLLPGQDWELEIRKGVREADVVVVCLSKQFNQAGFRQKEVKLALDTAIDKPEGSTFIVPVRLEESEMLSSLKKWHWVDLFESGGYEKLMRALRERAEIIKTQTGSRKERVPRVVMLLQRARKMGRKKTSATLAEVKPLSNVEKTIEEHKPPKVFISYAWEDDTRIWAREFASRLRADGVETILDQWATVPGDQLPQFMEKSVRASDFVLVICTPKYKRRCDGRHGGVGYEGDVITNELLIKRNHRKFIPILFKSKWISAAPSWLAGKYYLNLKGDYKYADDDYKILLRTLHHLQQVPPPVGHIPKYLD